MEKPSTRVDRRYDWSSEANCHDAQFEPLEEAVTPKVANPRGTTKVVSGEAAQLYSPLRTAAAEFE